MRITIERKALVAALRLAGDVASKSSTLPILAHVKLSARGFGPDAALGICANNLDASLEQSVQAEVLETGETSVSCARLLAAVDAMSGMSGIVELRLEGSRLCIKCDDDLAKLLCLDAADFPAMLGNPSGGKVIQVERFDLLCRVLPAVSTDATRYVLNGVFFDGALGAVVATDGRHLMKMDAGAVKRDGISGIVPLGMMKLLKKLAGEEAVNLEFGENNLVAEGQEWTLAGKLIEGNYPNYTQVIPALSGRCVEVPTSRFAKVFALASAVDGREHGIELREADGALEVKCESPEGETLSRIEGTVAKGFAAKFNAGFLAGIVKSMSGATVKLDMADHTMPAVFSDGEFLAVLMPLRLEVQP